jgi:glutamate transport system permease protein
MGYVVLPQALRAVVPPLASVFIALAKNTSVAAGFGLLEATARMRYFTNNNADDRTWIFVTFAVGYIIIVELISSGAITLERRWKAAR